MSYKTVTREVLKTKRMEFSLSETIELAQYMLKTGFGKENAKFAFELHGEICETVLEMLLDEVVKKRPECSMQKSLVLWNRKNPANGFLTELDWTLFTPECIYLFECKSYSGKKELTGEGILSRENGKSYNVYKQSVIHKETLYDWVEPFVLSGKTPLLQMVLFDFSQGEIEDKRSKVAKMELPVLNERTLLPFLENESKSEKVWNTRALREVGEKLSAKSDELRETHLKYVKKKHGKEET